MRQTKYSSSAKDDIKFITRMSDNVKVAKEFLKTPQRLEILVYLLLIVHMMLTVVERIVRNGLKRTNDVVYGIENMKQKKPGILTALKIVERVRLVTYMLNGKKIRKIRNIDKSNKKIIDFL